MVKELKLFKDRVEQVSVSGMAPMVGRVIDLPADGYLQVKCEGGHVLRARMVSSLAGKKPEHLLGQEVVLLFENNDPQKPIAVASLQATGDFASAMQAAAGFDEEIEASMDGEKVLIQAKEKLELRVGKASIVIDANGKITIRGASLLSRSTGPIRIKGGHVDIN